MEGPGVVECVQRRHQGGALALPGERCSGVTRRCSGSLGSAVVPPGVQRRRRRCSGVARGAVASPGEECSGVARYCGVCAVEWPGAVASPGGAVASTRVQWSRCECSGVARGCSGVARGCSGVARGCNGVARGTPWRPSEGTVASPMVQWHRQGSDAVASPGVQGRNQGLSSGVVRVWAVA